MERFTKLVGLLNCDSAGNPIDLAFKTPSETSFIDTFCNYLAVKDQAASLQNLGAAVSQAGDPLCDCPICAATPGAPGKYEEVHFLFCVLPHAYARSGLQRSVLN